MKTIIKRILISFICSSFAGLLCNVLIDVIVNSVSNLDGFISMSPEFISIFKTPVIAAYVNIILYGFIGAAFAGMTFIYDLDRIGFVVQSIIYFVGTSIVLTVITFVIWQLWKYPMALYCTLCGYAVSFIIMGVTQYRKLKNDINEINSYVG